MPYKTDRLKLGSPFLDRRTKMLPCQKERVPFLHSETGMGIRAITRMYKVDKRVIQFILFPERQKKNLADRKARGGTMQYYKGGKEWAETMQKHRKHKYLTLKDIPKT